MQASDTKQIYAEVYRPDGHDYGDHYNSGPGHAEQIAMVRRYVAKYAISDSAVVAEVGCGLGHLNVSHPGWKGFEYSATAVDLAKSRYGSSLDITEADARDLPLPDESVDMLFTIAALEHIPAVEKAFAEIERVLKPGGVAVLNPAWNCRSWTVKKLEERPYSDLPFSEKIGKFLIPLRDNLMFRMIGSLPGRVVREIKLFIGSPVALDYKKLEPDFSLWAQYGHTSDDDAFVSIDAHAGIVYFVSRGWECGSHGSFMARFGCRANEVVVRKPQVSIEANCDNDTRN